MMDRLVVSSQTRAINKKYFGLFKNGLVFGTPPAYMYKSSQVEQRRLLDAAPAYHGEVQTTAV